MTWVQLATFNVVLIVAIASPGPAMLMATQTSLSAGRAAGIAVGAGLGLMAAVWTMMALLGFGVVFELFPFLYVGAKLVGAAYLLFIAYRMWRSAGVPARAVIKPTGRAFRQGFLVNLFNPKFVVFAAAVLVTVFPAGIGLADSVVIVANHFLVEIVFYTAIAFGMSTQAVAKRYMRARVCIDRAAAAVLGALGVRILAWNNLGRRAPSACSLRVSAAPAAKTPQQIACSILSACITRASGRLGSVLSASHFTFHDARYHKLAD